MATCVTEIHPRARDGQVESLLSIRKELLAQVGEAYLVLEAHQAASQQCIQRLQQLRGQLQQLEKDLAAAGSEKGGSP